MEPPAGKKEKEEKKKKETCKNLDFQKKGPTAYTVTKSSSYNSSTFSSLKYF